MDAISDALSVNGHFPCTLVVLDEVQQYIGDNADRTLKVQEVTEACVKKFGGRLLFVGTGQSALSSTPQLQKLQGRFRLAVQLSDTDVETVIRQVVLAKKPDKVPPIQDMLAASSGEISRHLVGTRIEPRPEDQEHDVADYPLLPVRSRFWECVLRAVDQAGTAGQLRNQLKIVHEAVKQIADAPFGTVVAGDFIYDQIATDLLQTGVLLSEIHELIQKQRSGAPEGELRSRLCALIFLIGKLPKKNGADIGLRATPEALADLLVQDLKAGGAQLRMHIPELLRGLVEAGSLLQVDNEYRLQTRESSAWETDWRNRLATILHDDARLASERADLLRVACAERIKNVRLQHGKSREARHLELCFTRQAPEPTGQVIPVWVRDGWNDDEKSVLADARKAGTDSPMIFVFIPRRNSDELKQAIASVRAAEETLQVRGIPTTPAGLEARQAMDTRKLTAERTLRAVVGEVLSGARVFLAGGSEYTGADLNAVVLDAAQHALTRLYPHFDLADDPRWDKVIERARKGDGSALEVLGYHGDPGNHPVCSALFKEIGAGKKGRDLRRHFSNSPYGWPQDAIDGALLVLCVTDKVKATQDGKPIELKQLDQTRIGVAEFRTEQTTVTTGQRLAIRKLFQEAGVDFKPQEESAVAGEFLRRMLALAESAGGEAPLPARPDIKHLHQLSSLTGNEQLVALYNERERLVGEVQAWQHAQALIQKRRPRWEALHQLLDHARGLPVFADMHPQVMAIAEQRALLAEPDPMPGLCEQLTQALRQALVAACNAYKTDDDSYRSELTSSPMWQQLTRDQQAHILTENGLSAVPEVQVGTEADVLQSLHAISLDAWRMRRDALRQRFEKARLAAAQLREPKAVRIELPSATLCTEQELDNWLAAVRQAIMQGLKQGPVII